MLNQTSLTNNPQDLRIPRVRTIAHFQVFYRSTGSIPKKNALIAHGLQPFQKAKELKACRILFGSQYALPQETPDSRKSPRRNAGHQKGSPKKDNLPPIIMEVEDDPNCKGDHILGWTLFQLP